MSDQEALSEALAYRETCGELLGTATLDDAMTALQNALSTEYSAEAWAAVARTAAEVAYEAEGEKKWL